MSDQTADARAMAPPAQTLGAAVVPLLALAVFINYVDRGNLATAAPLMKDELHLTGTQIGLLISSFFWTYVPAQILAAWLAERFNAYRVLAAGLAIWSVATALSGLATGFTALLALRLVLGVGEGAAFPCSSKLIGQHLPGEKLGAANGMIAVGLALGPAFGTLAGGLAMAHLGWRPVFLLFGLASLLWLVPWWAATRHASAGAARHAAEDAPSFLAILSRRDAWGACLGHFCNNYAFYFVISWLPLYLVKSRGFSVAHMATIGGLIYLVYAASSWLTGLMSDRWMAAGASATRVRKGLLFANCALVFASLIAAALGDVTVSIAALFCAGFAFGLATPTIYAVGQTLAGPRVAGKWVGVQNCFGNLAGIVAPLVTGMVVDRTGQFLWAFLIAAGMALTGMVGWVAIIGKVAPLDWRAPRVA